MRFSILVLLAGLAVASTAQEQAAKPPPEQRMSKLIIVKHADPSELTRLLGVFNVGANANRDMKAISVSGTPESVTAYEEAVRRLDVPPPAPRNIELTAYILEASQQPEAATLPAELEGVARQLKSVFAFQGLRLLDTAVIRTREGQGASASGHMPYGTVQTAPYTLEFQSARFTDERLIRIDRLSMHAAGTRPFNTALDFKEGQKVVVGKSGIEGAQKALILVITGKAAE